MTAVVVLATAVVFGYLLHRALRRESAAGTALTLSSIALLLLLPAFWSGLPLVLGAGGALLGYAGKNAPNRAGKSTALYSASLPHSATWPSTCSTPLTEPDSSDVGTPRAGHDAVRPHDET